MKRRVYDQVRDWWTRDSVGLIAALELAHHESAKQDAVHTALCEYLAAPVGCTRGFYDDDVVEELQRARRATEWPDMGFVGDPCSTFEVIVDGPSNSPSALDDKLCSTGGSATILQLWVSWLVRSYTFDVFKKTYKCENNTWSYTAAPRTAAAPQLGHVAAVMKEHGLRRIGKRECAMPIDGSNACGAVTRKPLFEFIFTDLASRLQFDARGFHTRTSCHGTNVTLAGDVVVGAVDRALGLDAQWDFALSAAGELRQGYASFAIKKAQRVIVDYDNGKIVRLRIDGREVWRLP